MLENQEKCYILMHHVLRPVVQGASGCPKLASSKTGGDKRTTGVVARILASWCYSGFLRFRLRKAISRLRLRLSQPSMRSAEFRDAGKASPEARLIFHPSPSKRKGS